MSELKPCPLCRGTAEYERKGTARQSMIIVCDDCGLRCESGDVYGMTRVESYRWNTRPADAVREAAREVWESVPASHDPNDPMVQRHARALNALGAALAQDGRDS